MTDKEVTRRKKLLIDLLCFCLIVCVIGGLLYWIITYVSRKIPVPKIELASIDFTVHNITQTRLSAKWDMSIRIPYDLPGQYICLQGDLQASLLYKNVTLATSSPQK